MTPEILLSQISSISKAYDKISMKTGGRFNIFRILDIASNEVTICKVLYELLNPKGCHYQGTVYLELFLKQVLKKMILIVRLRRYIENMQPWKIEGLTLS